jgi:hypothetical protein
MSAFRDNPYRFFCRYCGRQWDTEGRSKSGNPARRGKSNATGFIASASNNHEYGCSLKSPDERRATNARDERRWVRTPPTASRIWNDPGHAGLKATPASSVGIGAADAPSPSPSTDGET